MICLFLSFGHSACRNCPLLSTNTDGCIMCTLPNAQLPVWLGTYSVKHVFLWVLGTQPCLAAEIKQKNSGEGISST